MIELLLPGKGGGGKKQLQKWHKDTKTACKNRLTRAAEPGGRYCRCTSGPFQLPKRRLLYIKYSSDDGHRRLDIKTRD
jgi:hypothetical protein